MPEFEPQVWSLADPRLQSATQQSRDPGGRSCWMVQPTCPEFLKKGRWIQNGAETSGHQVRCTSNLNYTYVAILDESRVWENLFDGHPLTAHLAPGDFRRRWQPTTRGHGAAHDRPAGISAQRCQGPPGRRGPAQWGGAGTADRGADSRCCAHRETVQVGRSNMGMWHIVALQALENL